MHETADGFYNIETPEAGSSLPPGRHRISGWLVSKPARHFLDLRARAGERLFPGVLGFPRPDLAAHFAPGRAWLPAGFTIDVDFLPGTATLQIEALDLRGEWISIGKVTFAVATGAAPTLPPWDPVTADEFAQTARLWLAHASGPDDVRAKAAAIDALPYPRVIRPGHLPFHGFVAKPTGIAPALYGQIDVSGWLFHETQPIRRVSATTDLLVFHPLEAGGDFPGVRERYPDQPQAADCRFGGVVAALPLLPSPASLRIYAELADGSLHLCLAVHCRAFLTEEIKAPGPALSAWRFWRDWQDLRRRLTARGATLEAGPTLRQAYRDVRMHARRIAKTALEPLAPPPPPRTPRSGSALCYLLITHNLNREGAPLLFAEYAGHLQRHGGVRLEVLAGSDGPLRTAYEAAGARVTIVDPQPLLSAHTAGEYRQRLMMIGASIDWSAFDLVVANTLASFWGVALAHIHGRRSLWYIHESTPPHGFMSFKPTVLPEVRAAFRQATAVSFNTPATRTYFESLSPGTNYHLNPAWIDLRALDAHRERASRKAIRADLGLGPSDRLVVNVGTVCARKGQHDFLRAVLRLKTRAPGRAKTIRCLLIGGRTERYNRLLDADIAASGLEGFSVVPETERAYDYFLAADLFVGSSYEESFPRVVLEAMAFAVPIVSTDVHGIPYMLRARTEAILVRPGDSEALASGMIELLQSPERAADMAVKARQRLGEFDAASLLPHHAAFACRIATGSPDH
jgi:glycosyltransferase involved in cell wall biosynthesis